MYVCVWFHELSPNIPPLLSHQTFPPLALAKYSLPSLSPNIPSPHFHHIISPPLPTNRCTSLPSLSPNISSPQCRQIFPPLALTKLSPNIPSSTLAKYSLPSLSPKLPSPRSRQVLSPLALAKYSFPSLSLNTPSLRSRQILPPLALANHVVRVDSEHDTQSTCAECRHDRHGGRYVGSRTEACPIRL